MDAIPGYSTECELSALRCNYEDIYQAILYTRIFNIVQEVRRSFDLQINPSTSHGYILIQKFVIEKKKEKMQSFLPVSGFL